jgi:hypothetical protein
VLRADFETGLTKEETMNQKTVAAILVALIAWPGMFAHAQPASTLAVKPFQTQGAAEPAVRCTNNDAGSRALLPCRARQPGETTHLGADVTRQEIECVLSGACGAAERARVNG